MPGIPMRASPSLLLLVVLAGCGGGAPQGPQQMPPPPGGTASPIQRDVPVLRELTGRVEAVEYVELKPRVGGLIEEVLVGDGAEVKPGQVLMRIDDRPLRADLARAEAAVARAAVHVA